MLSRAASHVGHVVFDASREGRSSEIVGWSHAIVALEIGAGVFYAARALPYAWAVALGSAVVAFVLLRAAITNAVTIWGAALLGTTGVASLSGALGWLFGHLVDHPTAPPLAGALTAVLSALLPIYAYRRLARLRKDGVADSLVEPPVPAAPPSRPSFA